MQQGQTLGLRTHMPLWPIWPSRTVFTLLQKESQTRGDATSPAHLAPSGNAAARIGYKAHRWQNESRIRNELAERRGKDGKDPEEAGWRGARTLAHSFLLDLCETK